MKTRAAPRAKPHFRGRRSDTDSEPPSRAHPSPQAAALPPETENRVGTTDLGSHGSNSADPQPPSSSLRALATRRTGFGLERRSAQEVAHELGALCSSVGKGGLQSGLSFSIAQAGIGAADKEFQGGTCCFFPVVFGAIGRAQGGRGRGSERVRSSVCYTCMCLVAGLMEKRVHR